MLPQIVQPATIRVVMKVTRRSFLKWAGLSTIGAVACNVFPDREMQIQSPVDLPEDLVSGLDNWYTTLCGQCPEREGIVVRVMEGRAKKVQGNPSYPTNQGKQSARCEGNLQTLYHPDRVAKPLLRDGPRGSRRFRSVEWDEAINILVGRLSALQGSNDTAAMRLVTDPLAGSLAKVVESFVQEYGGTHLVYDIMGDKVLHQVVKQVFGQDQIPNFDIENTHYLLSFGADFLSTWLSPVQYARGYGALRNNENGKGRGTFVHVDPRYSMTAANSDQWIPISPGMEGVVALGMAHTIILEGMAAPGAVESMSGDADVDALLAALDRFRPERITREDDPLYVGIPASLRGLDAAEVIKEIAREFATKGPSLAMGGGEAGAHTNGTFNLSAIFALNYLVGSVGTAPQEGGIVFNPAPPAEYASTGSSQGATFSQWLETAESIRSGDTKVLLVNGANPVHGLPNAAGFREALEGQTGNDLFMVCFTPFVDDTAEMADLVLPIRTSLEEWGDDVPNPGPGYQVVGFQQPVINPLPELDPRSFPDLLLTVSQELGLRSNLPNNFQEVVREGARQLFDLNRGSPQAATFDEFWNNLLQQGGWWDVESSSTASSSAAPNLIDMVDAEVTPSFRGPTGGNVFYLVPFLSNSMLDGRGGHLPWLQATPDPLSTVAWTTWVEINSGRAKEMGIKEGDLVSVVSREGSIEAVAYPHPAVPLQVVGIPLGQGRSPGLHYVSKDGEVRGANLVSILAAETDSKTEELAWAATRVRVEDTGRSAKVPKFEGIVPAFAIGPREEDVVQVTNETEE